MFNKNYLNRSRTRRRFLVESSLATGGLIAGSRVVSGLSVVSGAETGQHLLPEPSSFESFEQIAMTALNAAYKAGASYADIRVSERHDMAVLQLMGDTIVPDVRIRSLFNYGVRALVDGAWSFAYGTSPKMDDVARTAVHAVKMARTNAAMRQSVSGALLEAQLAPATVVKGTWSTPVQIDPFSVPIEDQVALMWACQQTADRVPGSTDMTLVMAAGFGLSWTCERRTFASSEGSLVNQKLYRSLPEMTAVGDRGIESVTMPLPSIKGGSTGYEAVLVPGLQDEMKQMTEEAVRFARLPVKEMDVGRYSVVVDGQTFATLLNPIAGQALELDRALGHEMGTSGTSFLASFNELLGTQSFSSLLTVTANRAVPSVGAVHWDDEGVEPQEYPVIAEGRIVDYHTSRQNAPILSAWYQRHGIPMKSRGCAVAPETDNPVLVRAPHLDAKSSSARATVDDLVRGVSRGLLIRNGDSNGLSNDQQFASGSFLGGLMLEIENGRIVRRLRDTGIQFNTKTLWKSLSALGDENTRNMSIGRSYKGQPWISVNNSTTAPAGLFTNVDVFSIGRRL